MFDFIEETIADTKGKDESTDICLMGDFDARTAILSDIMDNDEDLDFLNITADACKNASVVDYVICTDELFIRIADFYVDEFDPLLSDINCPIIFKISTQVHIDTNKKPHEQVYITNHDTCDKNTCDEKTTYNKKM